MRRIYVSTTSEQHEKNQMAHFWIMYFNDIFHCDLYTSMKSFKNFNKRMNANQKIHHQNKNENGFKKDKND